MLPSTYSHYIDSGPLISQAPTATANTAPSASCWLEVVRCRTTRRSFGPGWRVGHWLEITQILEGQFSAVSRPIYATGDTKS